MSAQLPPENPIKAMLRAHAAEAERRRTEHEAVRASPQYQAQLARLDTITDAFLQTLRICVMYASRAPSLSETSLFLRNTADLSESAVMASFAVREGGLNSGRRELRFMLELAVQSLFVDEQMASAPFDQRVVFFEKKTKHNSVDHVKALSLGLLGEKRGDIIAEVIAAWASASHYVHPTPRQLKEKLELREQGITPGYETAEQLRACVSELFRIESIVVVLLFHAIGAAFTGDLIVDGLDQHDAWPFHASRFIATVDATFDYKHERKASLAEIVARREKRLSF